MARIKQKPEERSGESFKGRDMVTHPAFGLVRVGRVSSSGTNLFDSDIDHSELIELTFHRAAIERDGYSYRITKSEDRSALMVVQLSAAQWAAMVSSFGVGEGVPCTLSSIRDGKLVHLPEIEKAETMHERFSKDIAARVRKDVADIENLVDQLGALIATGKAGKRDLRAIYESLSRAVINLPAIWRSARNSRRKLSITSSQLAKQRLRRMWLVPRCVWDLSKWSQPAQNSTSTRIF